MKKQKKIVAFSSMFQEMFLSKDIFLIPYYIAKDIDGNLAYYYMVNYGKTEIPSSHRGATFHKVKANNELFAMMQFVVMQAFNIDVLFLNGSSAIHMIVVLIYKAINPKGKVYIFGDMEPSQAKELAENGFVYSFGLSGKIKLLLANKFFNVVTYLVANTEAFHSMEVLFKQRNWKGLTHFYPLLDDEMFKDLGLMRRPPNEKDNIMVCVGRIGNYQKNTEMLLEALKIIDLKNWKIYMVGPITDSFNLNNDSEFHKTLDLFFENYPQYKDKLIFTGAIYNSREIFEYYNSAKVLLMTSRHESWGNVYSEAAALGCYILSTEVGGAKLASNNWAFGTKVEQEDYVGLSKAIESIIDGKITINHINAKSFDEMSYSTHIKELTSTINSN